MSRDGDAPSPSPASSSRTFNKPVSLTDWSTEAIEAALKGLLAMPETTPDRERAIILSNRELERRYKSLARLAKKDP